MKKCKGLKLGSVQSSKTGDREEVNAGGKRETKAFGSDIMSWSNNCPYFCTRSNKLNIV